MPGVLFDHMVARVAPYGLSGVLWYQGESNAHQDEAHRYAGLFGRLLEAWRGAWLDPALPFLTCQLAAFQSHIYGGSPVWPCLRAQQQLCVERYAHVSMATLLDVGMERNIHPLYKQPVADRLCRLALEDVYGLPAQAHAARPLACTLMEAAVLVHFSAPVTLRSGEWLRLVTVEGCAADTQVQQPSPCTLLLQAEGGRPVGACYAQADWLTPGLFDVNGLPVAPFDCRC